MFHLLAIHSQGQVDPTAPCQSGDLECCYSNKSAPVLAGIDFVDLANSEKQGSDGPKRSNMAFSSTLNGYLFGFLSQANKDTFDADPWSYAPAWGGF